MNLMEFFLHLALNCGLFIAFLAYSCVRRTCMCVCEHCFGVDILFISQKLRSQWKMASTVYANVDNDSLALQATLLASMLKHPIGNPRAVSLESH